MHANLLGMGADGDWVLHGNYYDRSLVRNALGFDLYREMGGYAPEGGWCELTLQGAPWGVYSLLEHIDHDDDRLGLSAHPGSMLDWVDLDSAVDIVILEELMRNNDGWFLSLYAWRDADKLRQGVLTDDALLARIDANIAEW